MFSHQTFHVLCEADDFSLARVLYGNFDRQGFERAVYESAVADGCREVVKV